MKLPPKPTYPRRAELPQNTMGQRQGEQLPKGQGRKREETADRNPPLVVVEVAIQLGLGLGYVIVALALLRLVLVALVVSAGSRPVLRPVTHADPAKLALRGKDTVMRVKIWAFKIRGDRFREGAGQGWVRGGGRGTRGTVG